MTIGIPATRQRPHYRWYWWTIAALLLGLFAWYATGQFLAPKPEWSLTLKDSSVNGSLLGTNDHQEWMFDSYPEDEPALLINMRTGSLKQRMNGLNIPRAPNNIRADNSPILHGRTAWWFQAEKTHSIKVNLFAQEQEQPDTRRLVHSWEPVCEGGFFSTSLRLTWGPINSGLFVLQTFIPQELLAVTSVAPFAFHLPCNIILKDLLAEDGNLALMQVWQIPKATDDKLRLLSSWAFQAGRHDNVSFSDDGTLLAIADEGEHDVRGVLIYNTRTGKLVKSIETEKRVRIAEFKGPFLFTKVVDLYPAYWENMIEKGISMSEGHPVLDVRRGVSTRLPEGFTHSADMSTDMQAHPTDPDWVFIKSRPNVTTDDIKVGWRNERNEYTLLKWVDDRFVKQSQFTVPMRTGLHWIGQGQLLAGWADNAPAPKFLADLAKKYDWINSVAERFWPTKKPGVVVYGPQGDLRYRFDDAVYVNPVWSSSQGTRTMDPFRFVLVRESKGDRLYRRIECYVLPISFYSRWWASGVGVTVGALVLVVWRMRRRFRSQTLPASITSAQLHPHVTGPS